MLYTCGTCPKSSDDREQFIVYSKATNKSPEKYQCRECKKLVNDRFRANLDPERRREYYRTSYQRQPERHVARIKVCAALKKGKISKPENCSVCNSKPSRIEAHHTDYSRPLEVIWLCTRCHRKHDKLLATR